MKKSLIALAALAAVGAASAQSSVTLYGIADISAGQVKTKSTIAGVSSTTKDTKVNPGNLQGSRIGIKGSEDLGNGLKAVFNYEYGIDSANGAFKATGDDGEARRAVVGLQGGFGSVLLGRDKTPFYRLTEDTSADSISDFSTTNAQGIMRVNGVHYAGNFSGVGVSAMAGYHNIKNNGVEAKDYKAYGLGLSYATGPFMVGIAGEKSEDSAVVNGLEQTNYGIGGTYDFTAAKLFANYLVNQDQYGNGPKSKDKEANIGVKVPFGAASLVAEYGYNDGENYDGHDFNIGANYAFSKRTDVYARAARINDYDLDNNAGSGNVTKYAVGLRHKF